MMIKIEITEPYRSRDQYQAKLLINGVEIGRVERGLTTGFGRNEYCARVEGITVASGRTINDLKAEIREWAEVEEVPMEEDAVWMRLGRGEAS